jgi:shikimate kinase
VGRQLARTLRLSFYDSDAEIERRVCLDVPLLFEKEGEDAFRQRERKEIERLTALERIVLSTGGGTVLLPENRRNLRERGRVVYRQTSVIQQAHRVGNGKNRPMLA